MAGDPEHATLDPFRDVFAPTVHAQTGDDLGTRMRSAMATLCATHAQVLLVGCDCPVLSAHEVRDAARALDGYDNDVVFIPVEDGGYILIGVRTQPASERQKAVLDAVFNGIPWSTAQVMMKTRDRLATAGLRWAEQATLWDIDRPEDLQRAVAMAVLDRRALAQE